MKLIISVGTNYYEGLFQGSGCDGLAPQGRLRLDREQMISVRSQPFPFEAVRDLLGIVRALYTSAKGRGAGQRDLARIARAGALLRESLSLAVQHEPGTLAHGAAWKKAEEAIELIGTMVDALTPARPILEAATQRVKGIRGNH